jgi:hypothetical protein
VFGTLACAEDGQYRHRNNQNTNLFHCFSC